MTFLCLTVERKRMLLFSGFSYKNGSLFMEVSFLFTNWCHVVTDCHTARMRSKVFPLPVNA